MARRRRTSRPPEKKKKKMPDAESDHSRSPLDELNDAFNGLRAGRAGLPDVTNAIVGLFGGIRKLSGKPPDQLFEFNFRCAAEMITLLLVRMRLQFRRELEGLDAIDSSKWHVIRSNVVETMFPFLDAVIHLQVQTASAYAKFKHVMSLTTEDANVKNIQECHMDESPRSNGRCQTRSRKVGGDSNKTNGRRPTRIRDSIS